jgi:hypothetical protein
MNDIISLINEKKSYNVYIPSLDQEVKFKPLSVKQLKKVLDESIIQKFYNVGFNIELHTIIKENIVGNIEVDKLTEYDRYFIALSIRLHDISDHYNGVPIQVDLKLPEFKHPSSKEINNNNIIIRCNIPTLDIDNIFCKYIEELVNKHKEARTALETMFTAELSKYITEIQIDETIFKFSDYSFSDWVSLISDLPISLFTELLVYIDSVKNTITSLYTISDDEVLPYNVDLFFI